MIFQTSLLLFYLSRSLFIFVFPLPQLDPPCLSQFPQSVHLFPVILLLPHLQPSNGLLLLSWLTYPVKTSSIEEYLFSIPIRQQLQIAPRLEVEPSALSIVVLVYCLVPVCAGLRHTGPAFVVPMCKDFLLGQQHFLKQAPLLRQIKETSFQPLTLHPLLKPYGDLAYEEVPAM